MPLREGAVLGCAVPTGLGLVRNDAGVLPGQSVALFGVGGIGLAAVLGAVLAEAGPVIAVDLAADRLSRAKAPGATHCVNASDIDRSEERREGKECGRTCRSRWWPDH